MDNFKQKQFEKYFFYGLENRDILLEGIIFYTNHDLNVKYLNIPSGGEFPSLKEKFRTLIEKTSRNCEQIYKFVDLVQEEENYSSEIGEEEKTKIKEQVFNKVKELDDRGVFMKYKTGLWCTTDFEHTYAYQNHITGEKPPHKWTKEVYETVLQLNYLEENEPIEYYDKFLQAKLSRAKNKEGHSEEEIEKIEEVYRQLQERKEQEKIKEI